MRRIALVVAISLCACKDKSSSPPPAAKVDARPVAGDPVKPGTVKRPPIDPVLGVAIPKGADVEAAERLARERGKAAKLEVERKTVEELGFDREHLGMVAKPLSSDEIDRILESSAVLLIRGKGKDGLAVLRAIAEDASTVADASHGWVVDPDIFGVFSAEAFRARVPGAEPDIRNLIVVHAVTGGNDLPYLDTMGMLRLGLPELYVASAAPGQTDRYTTLLDVVAQTLLDRGDVGRAGEIELDLARLHGDWNLAHIREQGGTGKAKVQLRWSKGSGDHDVGGELSIEVVPPGGATTDAAEALFSQFFGASPDDVTYVSDDDPELVAAGERARAELAKLRKELAKGIPFKESLAVKAKFTDDDGGVEWMWIDVVRFTGNAVDGTLDNDPQIVTNVRAGQRVKAKLEDLADYVHTKADGTQVGGYSIEVFRKRGLVD